MEARAGGAGPWTQRVGALCHLPELLRELGHDPRPSLRSAGLPADALDDPDNRIEYSAFGRLLAILARETGTPHFGLLAGRSWTLERMGLLGGLMQHSSTLGEALGQLTTFHRLNSDGGTVFFFHDQGFAALGYAVHQPRVDGIAEIHDGVMVCGCNIIRQLVGRPWNPARVVLARRRPADVRPYLQVFGTSPEFDSDHTAIYLPRSQLSLPVPGADDGLRRQLEGRLQALVMSDLLVQVHRALRLLILEGEPDGDALARRLGMHRRTLSRRLRARGTNVRQALDGVRFDVSRQLLGHTGLSLGEVAAAAGYADTATFIRAFRRWSGVTPARWRARRMRAE